MEIQKEISVEEGRWVYQAFKPDIAPETLPQFENLIRLWQSRKNDRRVPAWKDFDFFDFKGWHGWISIYDITYDPFDWTVRLSGTQFDEIFGATRKGTTKSQQYERALEEQEANEFYEEVCKRQLIAHTNGPLNIQGCDFHSVEYLELPCSDGPPHATHTIEAMIAH